MSSLSMFILFPRSLSRCLALSVVLGAASVAPAQDWLLTTADFQTEPVKIQSIDATTLVVVSGGASRPVKLADVLDLTRTQTLATKVNRLVINQTDGDRFAGEPVGVTDERLRWKTPSLGTLDVPLRQVRSIAPVGEPVQRAASTEDVVLLSNGDTVSGVLQNFDGERVTLNVNGDSVPVPLASLARIDFASSASPVSPAGGQTRFRIRLVDGSVVTAPSLQADATGVSMELGGSPRNVKWIDVALVEQLDGPVSWLSVRQPVESVQIPHVSPRTWDARTDRAVDGSPIRFGDRTYAHGLGVHAYSRLKYSLDGTYRTFRTRYAIAGDLPYADVTVRVLLDDKVVHESKNVRAGALSDVVELDVSSAKSLTLEVDYGAGNDVQDRLNWIEPALLRAGR